MQSRGWAAEVPASLRNCGIIEVGQTSRKFAGNGWWATLESNQAWVSPAELQSAAAPCSTSPDAGAWDRRGDF